MSQQEAIRILALEAAVERLTAAMEKFADGMLQLEPVLEEMEKRLAALEAPKKKAP